MANCILTTVWYQDEILGAIVRPFPGAAGPRLLLVQDNVQLHETRVRRRLLDVEDNDSIDWPSGSP